MVFWIELKPINEFYTGKKNNAFRIDKNFGPFNCEISFMSSISYLPKIGMELHIEVMLGEMSIANSWRDPRVYDEGNTHENHC